MFPDLIDLGFIHLKTYGACMAVGFLVCWHLIERMYNGKWRMENSPASQPLSNLIFYMMISGVLGARIAYVIEHWSSEFAANPAAIIRVDQGGLMFYGGFLLATAVFFIFCRLKGLSIPRLVNIFATVLPLGHACGRIGCFFYGCCYGKISESPFAVCFPRSSPAWYEQLHKGLIDSSARCSLPVIPTQLIEAGMLLVLFAALYLNRNRRMPNAALYLLGYGVIRFVLEYLRGDPRVAFFGLSIGQCISLGLFTAGIICAVISRRLRGREVAKGSR